MSSLVRVTLAGIKAASGVISMFAFGTLMAMSLHSDSPSTDGVSPETGAWQRSPLRVLGYYNLASATSSTLELAARAYRPAIVRSYDGECSEQMAMDALRIASQTDAGRSLASALQGTGIVLRCVPVRTN